ncbi:MAG: site-2 protease family protein, partial [Acidobacteriota bacterium]
MSWPPDSPPSPSSPPQGEPPSRSPYAPPSSPVVLEPEYRVAREPAPPAPGPTPRERAVRLPLLLFLLTCGSVLITGGPAYAAALMTILLCHEFGHYLQARRHGVPASLPFFLPLPLISPFGTLGAVIGMRPNVANSRQLYDIAISGPLAGLVPTVLFAFIGLRQSNYRPTAELPEGPNLLFGEPLLFEWIAALALGPA